MAHKKIPRRAGISITTCSYKGLFKYDVIGRGGGGGYPKISLLITRGEGGVWRRPKSDHVILEQPLKVCTNLPTSTNSKGGTNFKAGKNFKADTILNVWTDLKAGTNVRFGTNFKDGASFKDDKNF